MAIPEYEQVQMVAAIYEEASSAIEARLQHCVRRKELLMAEKRLKAVLRAVDLRKKIIDEHGHQTPPPTPPPRSKGSVDAFRFWTLRGMVADVYEKEGIFGFYKGLSSGLAGMGLSWGLYYYWYNALLPRKPTSIDILRVAAMAGTITCVFTNPIWVVNTRVKMRKGGSSKGLVRELSDIVKEEGIPGWFRGIGPALVLVANPTIQFLAASYLNGWLRRRRAASTPLLQWFVGAISKLASTMLTYPYQVIKTKRQLDGDGGKDKGLVESLRTIVGEDGVLGLYQGMGLKIYQTVLTSAFMFMFYDIILKRLRMKASKIK